MRRDGILSLDMLLVRAVDGPGGTVRWSQGVSKGLSDIAETLARHR